MMHNSIKYFLMALVICGVSFSPAFAASEKERESTVNEARLERPGDIYDVTLFGQRFALDTFMIDGTSVKWEKVGHLVPKIMPSIQNAADQREPLDIDIVLQRVEDEYFVLFNKQVDAVAKRLQDKGHLNIGQVYDPAPEMVTPLVGEPFEVADSELRRYNHIRKNLRALLLEDGVEKAVADYNAAQERAGKPTARPEQFANLDMFFKRFQAAYGLRVMVVASPQMQTFARHGFDPSYANEIYYGEEDDGHGHHHHHDHE